MFGKGYKLTKGFGGRGRGSDRPEPTEIHEPLAVPLEAQPPRPTTPVEERVGVLDDAVAAVTPYLKEDFLYSAVLVNPLLVVWGAAQEVGIDVASPVEELLTDLVHRTTVASTEILVAMDEVRARALQVLVLEACSLSR